LSTPLPLARHPRPADDAYSEAVCLPTTRCGTCRLHCLDPLLGHHLLRARALRVGDDNRGTFSAWTPARSRGMSAGDWRGMHTGQPGWCTDCSNNHFHELHTTCASNGSKVYTGGGARGGCRTIGRCANDEAEQATDGQSDRVSRHAPNQQPARTRVSCPPFHVLCACIYIYLHTYNHTYIHIYISTYLYVSIHTYEYTYTYIHLYTSICIYIQIYISLYIYIHLCTSISIYIHLKTAGEKWRE